MRCSLLVVSAATDRLFEFAGLDASWVSPEVPVLAVDGIAVEMAIKLLAFASGDANTAIEELTVRLGGSSEAVSDGRELGRLDGVGVLEESNDLGAGAAADVELEFP